jgi:hypothetical protein
VVVRPIPDDDGPAVMLLALAGNDKADWENMRIMVSLPRPLYLYISRRYDLGTRACEAFDSCHCTLETETYTQNFCADGQTQIACSPPFSYVVHVDLGVNSVTCTGLLPFAHLALHLARYTVSP